MQVLALPGGQCMEQLDARIEESLRAALKERAGRGLLLSTDQLQASYDTFRGHFGPDALKSLDGLALLQTMHAHGSKDSLVYWLEFKTEDEFRSQRFGSIAGGSAHKFGLFRRKESGQWVEGSAKSERIVSESDAIGIARQHREQLLAGVAILEALPANSDDMTYLGLQERLEREASDICGLAWSHKYWSLLFPAKLDDFHNARLQRYHLLRSLELPPSQEGLYVSAGRFVRVASMMNWPIN